MASGAVPAPQHARHQWRGRDWLLILLAVAPLLALVGVAIVSVGHGYLGVSDNGMTELRVSDIGSHWPLIGPFSRDGWSHPGPALFYALVLPYRLTGSHSNGLLVGAALINAGAVLGMVGLARRWGGAAFAVLVALGCLVLVSALGSDFVWDPWNPFVTVLPFGLVVFAAWAVTCGDVWCLPVLAGVGSFCVQTHVGYVPLVAVLTIAAVGALVLASRRHAAARQPGPALRAPILATAGVLLVLWLPPIVQQLTTTPGNLHAVVDYFSGGHEPQGWHQGFKVVAAQFAWNPDWLLGAKPVNPFSGAVRTIGSAPLPVWWLALGASLGWAWHRGITAARRFGALLVLAIAASLLAVARTIGPLLEYRLRFVWVLGMLTAVYAAWMLWSWLVERRWLPRAAVAAISVAASATVVGLSGYEVVHAASADAPNAHEGRVAAALARELVTRLPAGPGPVVITVKQFGTGPLITGIMVDLERHGVSVALHDQIDDRLRFGAQRMLGSRPVRAEIRVTENDEIERLARRPCTRELAYWGAAPRHRRERALATLGQTRRALARGDITGPVAYRRIARVSVDLPAAAVFELHTPDAGC